MDKRVGTIDDILEAFVTSYPGGRISTPNESLTSSGGSLFTWNTILAEKFVVVRQDNLEILFVVNATSYTQSSTRHLHRLLDKLNGSLEVAHGRTAVACDIDNDIEQDSQWLPHRHTTFTKTR